MKLEIIHSTSHLVFPKIVITILGILLIILLIQRYLKTKKTGVKFLSNNFSFFKEESEPKILLITIVDLILFILLMKKFSFIVGGIVCISILNILYNKSENIKNIILSILISVIETLIVWFLFSQLFGITLP